MERTKYFADFSQLRRLKDDNRWYKPLKKDTEDKVENRTGVLPTSSEPLER